MNLPILIQSLQELTIAIKVLKICFCIREGMVFYFRRFYCNGSYLDHDKQRKGIKETKPKPDGDKSYRKECFIRI